MGWYNGHPDYPDREFDLHSCERVVVVGNGNVAIDCARMLALSADELRMTDCADHAIDMLASDAVREIVILGRRGPAQASFTNPELLELGELELADVIVDPADVELDEASQAWLDSDEADKTSRENVRILREYAEREPTGKPKRIVLRFLTSPVELQGDERVERIVVERNRLEPRDDGSLAARPTGERETLECGLVLRSIGYKGIGIPEVPFDESRGTIPNVAGRVVDGEHHVTGEYVTGWIRRGPSGVIGTNKKDGQEAASSLLEDAEAGLLNEPASDGDIADLLAERGVEPISWEGWERIDAHEQELGSGTRPRVKLTRYELLHGARARREASRLAPRPPGRGPLGALRADFLPDPSPAAARRIVHLHPGASEEARNARAHRGRTGAWPQGEGVREEIRRRAPNEPLPRRPSTASERGPAKPS